MVTRIYVDNFREKALRLRCARRARSTPSFDDSLPSAARTEWQA